MSTIVWSACRLHWRRWDIVHIVQHWSRAAVAGAGTRDISSALWHDCQRWNVRVLCFRGTEPTSYVLCSLDMYLAALTSLFSLQSLKIGGNMWLPKLHMNLVFILRNFWRTISCLVWTGKINSINFRSILDDLDRPLLQKTFIYYFIFTGCTILMVAETGKWVLKWLCDCNNARWKLRRVLLVRLFCRCVAYAFAELVDNALAATANNVGTREIDIRLVCHGIDDNCVSCMLWMLQILIVTC